jgi:DNA-binding IscR family transcriptional regulator
MFIYGKTSANAISVMSYLATDPSKRSGSSEIAKTRGISLDIACLFEQTEPPSVCPFGHDWCGGKGDPCPLHDTIAGTIESNRKFMENTSLAVFEGKPPRMPEKKPRAVKKKG